MKTCLNRLIGRCEKKCKRDYNPEHHPNNYDCPDYQEAHVLQFKINDEAKIKKRELEYAVD